MLYQSRSDLVAQSRSHSLTRKRSVRGKVGEKVGALPVGDSGHDLIVPIGGDCLKVLALLGRTIWWVQGRRTDQLCLPLFPLCRKLGVRVRQIPRQDTSLALRSDGLGGRARHRGSTALLSTTSEKARCTGKQGTEVTRLNGADDVLRLERSIVVANAIDSGLREATNETKKAGAGRQARVVALSVTKGEKLRGNERRETHVASFPELLNVHHV